MDFRENNWYFYLVCPQKFKIAPRRGSIPMDNTSIITQVNKEDESIEVTNTYTQDKRKFESSENVQCTFCPGIMTCENRINLLVPLWLWLLESLTRRWKSFEGFVSWWSLIVCLESGFPLSVRFNVLILTSHQIGMVDRSGLNTNTHENQPVLHRSVYNLIRKKVEKHYLNCCSLFFCSSFDNSKEASK